MPQKAPVDDKLSLPPAESMRAFDRLNEARMEIRQYLPKGFDPDRELKGYIASH